MKQCHLEKLALRWTWVLLGFLVLPMGCSVSVKSDAPGEAPAEAPSIIALDQEVEFNGSTQAAGLALGTLTASQSKEFDFVLDKDLSVLFRIDAKATLGDCGKEEVLHAAIVSENGKVKKATGLWDKTFKKTHERAFPGKLAAGRYKITMVMFTEKPCQFAAGFTFYAGEVPKDIPAEPVVDEEIVIPTSCMNLAGLWNNLDNKYGGTVTVKQEGCRTVHSTYEYKIGGIIAYQEEKLVLDGKPWGVITNDDGSKQESRSYFREHGNLIVIEVRKTSAAGEMKVSKAILFRTDEQTSCDVTKKDPAGRMLVSLTVDPVTEERIGGQDCRRFEFVK